MNGTDLIAADPATVIAAGHRTADTAGAWGSWAGRCAYAFAEAGRAMRNARIELAASRYAMQVVGGARQVERRVESLGAGTASAGAVVDTTDAEAASVLRRPVNGARVPV